MEGEAEGAVVVEEEEEGPPPPSRRPEWAGVAPLLPPPTPQPVVEIERDPQLGELMEYFYAATSSGDTSERALALTEEIILELNSSNYSVWEWRARCAAAGAGPGGLAAAAPRERALMRRVAAEGPKNYQLWNHRRRVALALGAPAAEEELEFAAACLTVDAKNYHAWAHRQAVLELAGAAAPGLWQQELAYTAHLLRRDACNNSAWNQRAFVLGAAPAAALGPPPQAYAEEVALVAGALRRAPHNEAAWGYMRGLARGPGAPCTALAADPAYFAACRSTLEAHPSCVPALGLLAEVFAAQAALLRERGRQRAADAAGGLAQRVLCALCVADPLRRGYWRWSDGWLV